MSYDVEVGGEDVNYTSNMRPMMSEFGMYPPDWDGRNRREVGLEIGAGLRRLVRERDADRAAFDRKYDAPNGWGSVDTALRWLLGIYFACFYEMPETVRVWF